MKCLIINAYRPPNCSEDRISFGECLEKIQLTINDYYKAASNLIVCSDFNFDFIKWPQGSFKGRGKSVASDKIQASNLLDLAECYDLQNISIFPTRQINVLDLVFTTSDSVFYRDMMVNSSL